MAHLLMLHGHPVGYLPPTMASEILYDNNNTVKDKIDEVEVEIENKSSIKYEDVTVESQSIPSGGAIDIYAPSDRKYIGCIFTSSSGVNAVLVSQLIYRPSSVNKWTTHLYNYYNSALTISGYMRFFYIE